MSGLDEVTGGYLASPPGSSLAQEISGQSDRMVQLGEALDTSKLLGSHCPGPHWLLGKSPLNYK